MFNQPIKNIIVMLASIIMLAAFSVGAADVNLETGGGESDGERTTLNVVGHDPDGSETTGEIRMQLENGAWRISNESFHF